MYPGSAPAATRRVPPRWASEVPAPDDTHTCPPTTAIPRTAPRASTLVFFSVSREIRKRSPEYFSATHREPRWTTTAVGPSPTSTECACWVGTSMRVTVWESSSATQTSLPARTMPRGPLPTRIGANIGCLVWASMRVTEPARPFATQTDVSSTASPSGPSPTSIGLVVAPLIVSMRWIVLSPLFATQSPAGPAAIAAGALPTGMLSTTFAATRLIRAPAPSAKFAPPRSSPVTAIECGSCPTSSSRSTACVAVLTLDTVLSPALMTQTAPRPAARAIGFVPTGTDATTDPDSSSLLTTFAAPSAGAPDSGGGPVVPLQGTGGPTAATAAGAPRP